MSANSYALGKVVRVQGTFAQNSIAVDPTTVSVLLRRPDGIKRTYVYGTDAEVIRQATGIYYLEYPTVLAGQHWYRWSSTGNGRAPARKRSSLNPRTHWSK
jgi:hypothetical protein